MAFIGWLLIIVGAIGIVIKVPEIGIILFGFLILILFEKI